MIYTIGETVFDIIFKNNKPISAVPGGSMLNVSISLSRLDVPVSFISEIGSDLAGNVIKKFLLENNVNIDYTYFYEDGNTIISLAFLDDKNNANYNFYKNYSKKRLNIESPEFNKDYIVWGSFFSIDKQIYDKLSKIITNAKKNNCLIFFDPNFRIPHLKDLNFLFYNILLNMLFSDVIKLSNEDFITIFSNLDRVNLSVERIFKYFYKYFSLYINLKDKEIELKLKSHLESLVENLKLINSLLKQKNRYDFNKFSDLFNKFFELIIKKLSDIYKVINFFDEKILVITNGKDPVTVFYKDKTKNIDVKQIKPVSTIGAGDTFNAGLAYGFFKKGIDKNKIKNISIEDLVDIISESIRLSQIVCQSYENYIPKNI